MQTTFTKKDGSTFAPNFFAVYHTAGGGTFKKVQSELHTDDFANYDNVTKIDLYENGTENLSPNLKETIYNR